MSVKQRETQLNFFGYEEQTKSGLDEKFKESMIKRTNGLFARYNELEEVFWELKASVDRLKNQIYSP